MRRTLLLLPFVVTCSSAHPVRGVAEDPFGLRTPWAGSFAPVAARQTSVSTASALRAAVSKGGTIDIAPGTYDLSGSKLIVRSDTVLRGSGIGVTVLEVGSDAANGDGTTDHGILLQGDTIGVQGLTVRNSHADGAVFSPIRGGSAKGIARVFWDKIEIVAGSGQPPTLSSPTDTLIRNCHISSTSSNEGPLRISGGSRLQFEHNRVEYRSNRVGLSFLTDATISDNTFTLDGDYHQAGVRETGGVELSYAHGVDFLRNHVVQKGRPSKETNDGELINTQTSNVHEFYGAGAVQAGSGLTWDTDMHWGDDPWLSTRNPITQRKAIYLLTGKGEGQWRWATPGAADGTVKIDRPWDIAPGPGDRVALGSVTAYRLRMEDNVIQGGTVGINIYSGGIEVSARRNQLIDTGSLVFRSDSREAKNRTPHSTIQHCPLIDSEIVDNQIRNDIGSVPAALALVDLDSTEGGLPMGMVRVRATGNKVSGQGQTRRGAVGAFDGIQAQALAPGRVRRIASKRLFGVQVGSNVVVGGRSLDKTLAP